MILVASALCSKADGQLGDIMAELASERPIRTSWTKS